MTPSYGSRALLGGVFFTYFVATVVLVFVGPWQYPMTPDGERRLIVFLVAVHAAFAGGYLLGIRGGPRPVRAFPVRGAVLLAVVLQVLLLFPTSYHYTGHWIPNPWSAMSDVGDAYARTRVIRLEHTPYVNYVRMFVAPLLAMAVPLAVFYWRRLGWTTRGLFAFSIVGTIALFVSMGTNAGAGNWMALFPWFVLAGHLSGAQRLKAPGWAAAVGVEVCSLLIFAVMFSASMTERKGSYVKYGVMPGINTQLRSGPPPTAAAPAAPAAPTPFMPPQASAGLNGLAVYLTQGYYAVYLSLQQPFVPTYGLGNSQFLLRQAARIFDDPGLLERPYPNRIEKQGWKADVYWASIYPWIASDVSFPGTVVVMLLVGWMVGRVWVDVLGGENPVAVAFLGQILLLLYYVPAHNRVMQSGEDVFAFVGLLALWGVTRRVAPVEGADVAVAFVGSLVPDSPEFHGLAFSRAGQRTQRRLVQGLRAARSIDLEVMSIEPIQAFPRQRRLCGRWRATDVLPGVTARFIPFVNIKPLKVMTTGAVTTARLVAWAWRHRGQPRVVCVYNLSMPPAIFVLAATKATGTKAVALLFDFGKPGRVVPNTWSWWLDFLINRHAVRAFDGHVVTTPVLADDLVPGAVAHVMDGGIERDQFVAMDEPTHGGRARRFRMVLAGTLATYNGVEIALDALRLLPEEYELVVAGDGPLGDLVRARAERDPRVQYAGMLDFGSLVRVYQSADLLLNLKLTQSVDTKYFFPSKLMELLGSGSPVLTTCTGHVADAYAEFVYLLRDETASGLAGKIQEIVALGAEARRTLGACAREFVLREKTWDVQGRRLAVYVRGVADQREASRQAVRTDAWRRASRS
ncbi:MAG TPA: glycosyltransferase family 4 protein [Vicinamibacterales bacterium]|jgi:glycosyltransferase involved in cell wall biosynthesis|nr:glycosyltransferase family 4 protein [Vicinamibacterales bacterium]